MDPIKFKECNTTYVADGCEDLPAYKDDTQIISCWSMTLVERFKVLITGKIWYSVLGQQQPPVWIDVNNPFKK